MRLCSSMWFCAAASSLLGAAALAGQGCSRDGGPAQEQNKPARPPVPVLVAVAGQADVSIELRALGTVEPLQSSPVRAQVGGTITEVLFREGDLVKSGQVLFRIDPRPVEATLRQLQANLARDEAQMRNAEAQQRNAEAQVRSTEARLKNAQSEAKRYEDLVGKDLISREQYEQRQTDLDSARAALDASRAALQAGGAQVEAARAAADATRAAIENARLQLEYTAIKSPVAGRTGALLADKGDLVKVNDTTLLVINQIQPILVRFPVPEPRLPEVQRYLREGTLKVRVTPPGDGAMVREGRIVFLDNTVDRTTGTIALKAQFDNADAALWPGQFVEVALALTTRAGAVVVPTQAIQTGQQGTYVFVVEAGGTATIRPVVTGYAADGRTLVEKGLSPGETLVTDGQIRLTPGAPVAPRSSLAPPPSAPGAATSKAEKPR